MDNRWFFQKEKKIWRLFFIFFFLGLTIIGYRNFNLAVGTFFLFMTSYFLGSSKGRLRIQIIPNESIDSAVSEICSLINGSARQIRFLSGGLNPEVYSHPDVIAAFEKAKSRNVTIKAFTKIENVENAYKNSPSKGNSILKFIAENRIELYDVDRDLGKVNHFMVCDREASPK